ncbi:MAG TPA: hypothetical protein VIL46_11580, partial [Gemmataceae bacterium]
MHTRIGWLACLGLFLSAGRVSAAEAEAAPPPELIAATLRGLLLAHLPVPLVEAKSGWGGQRMTAVGVKWERVGRVRFRPEVMRQPKNDGVWRRVRVVVDDPQRTLALAVRDVRLPEPGTLTFEIWSAFPCHIHYDQQNWRGGLRLYSGSARARCRVAVRLKCEATSRVELSGSLLPDAVLRFRVTEAELHYDQFRVENLFGIGGDGARLLGEALHEFLRERRPGLEKELREKANAAIVKAGDTKEIRVSFARLLEG